jgi:hypothetical protein
LLKPEEMFEKKEMNLESLLRKRKKIYFLLSNTLNDKIPNNFKENMRRSDEYNFCNKEKSKSQSCTQKCSFKLEQIKMLTYKVVNDEIKLHHHPSSRINSGTLIR